MPIVIPKALPANKHLREERIFVMNKARAEHQDIRPLEIVILNLMPTKEVTELQLLRLLGNTPIQINITLLKTDSYEPQNVAAEHLKDFYKTFEDIKDLHFDGLIITGAPVETLPFEEVKYWDELQEIMTFSKTNVTSTLHICWGAQAGLYHHYGVTKKELPTKVFGVFANKIYNVQHALIRGFDDEFYAPQSRHTDIDVASLRKIDTLEILAESDEAGVLIAATKDKKQVFVTGHMEYDTETLEQEYLRDLYKGLEIEIPKNYFINNKPELGIVNRWRNHGHILFSNWINYCVYQETPYEL